MRFAVLVSLLAGLALFAARTWPTSVEELRGPVEQAGAWAPLVFVVGYVAAAVALVPASLLTVAGGVLFGPAVGAALVLIAATVGATVAFGLARWLGRDGVRAMLGGRLASVDRWIGHRGFASVLVLRLVPLFPYNVLNYAVGLTGVTWRAYVLATAIGIAPATIAYTLLGGSIDDPLSPPFLVAVGLIVALVVGGSVARRRLSASAEPAEPDREHEHDEDGRQEHQRER